MGFCRSMHSAAFASHYGFVVEERLQVNNLHEVCNYALKRKLGQAPPDIEYGSLPRLSEGDKITDSSASISWRERS